MKKKIIITAFIAVGVIICMSMIFHFSSQEGEVSDSISRDFTLKAARLLMKDFDSFSDNFRRTVISQLNIFIRKLAHFSIFFSMGAMIFGIASVWTERYLRSFAAALSCCCIYACLDEYHQTFIPGRTALATDVLIDVLGGLMGALICFIFICAGRFLIGRYKDRFMRKDSSAPPSASL